MYSIAFYEQKLHVYQVWSSNSNIHDICYHFSSMTLKERK